MKIKNKLISFALLLSITLIPSLSTFIGADEVESYQYEAVRTYDDNFTDISADDWFYDEVSAAYSLGLINGQTDTSFMPNGELTIAETVKLAALCHQLLKNGKISETQEAEIWYQPYLDYCKTNNIVTEDYDDYDAPALRCQIAVLFSRAITASGTKAEELNEIKEGVLSDIESSDWYAGTVYRMYRWGILTGDEKGNINPNTTIKRCEIAAVVMRVINPSVRVEIGKKAEPPAQEPDKTVDKILLYDSSDSSASFSGITGFSANFVKGSDSWEAERSYSLNLIDHLVLEPDNISFRLYAGAGYEALGIVRGWLNATARGQDGEEVRKAETVREELNELFRIWINGESIKISEMWYADHGEYVTYAFYFEKNTDLENIDSVDLMCGRIGSDIMSTDALSEIKKLLGAPSDSDEPENKPEDATDIYKVTVNDVKTSALEILFEYECSRCFIIYGRGMYGGDSGEYRLLFIFRDGSTQTVYTQKLEEIRMNQSGDVLYYTVNAPDGQEIQYGVNFKD